MSQDHQKGYVTHACGCCVFVYRAELVRALRARHGDALVCRIACDGTPGAVDLKQLEQTLVEGPN